MRGVSTGTLGLKSLLRIRLVQKAAKEMDVNVRDTTDKAWRATLGSVTPGSLQEQEGSLSELLKQQECAMNYLLKSLKWKRGGCVIGIIRGRTTLHDYCFHEGRCEPIDEVKRRISETRECIEDVKKLVGS